MIKIFIQQTGILRHASILLAVVLAVVSGDLIAGCGTPFIVADSVIFALTTNGMALIVWNILRFTLWTESQAGRLGILIAGLCTAWCAVGIGIECTAMLFISSGWFNTFTPLIPFRIAVMLLIFMVTELNTERGLLLKDLVSAQDSEPTAEIPPAEECRQAKEVITQISIKSGQRLDIVNVEDIIFMQADGDYVSIVTENGHYLKEQTMKYFEERLPQDMFARVHRSFIVRLSAISRIERYGQMQQLELCNKEKIRVSPAGYRILKEKLKL